jgi:hypothetical protein
LTVSGGGGREAGAHATGLRPVIDKKIRTGETMDQHNCIHAKEGKET